MGSAIVISGTPGVGKTYVATRLADRLGLKYLNLSELVISGALYVGRDEARDTYVIDEERLVERVKAILESSERDVVVDSHYGEIIPDELVRIIFVLRLNPALLYGKLAERGWGEPKILENVEAELLSVCTSNALDEHPESKVCEVDVSGKDLDKVVDEIIEVLNSSRTCYTGIDWLTQELPEDLLTKLLNRGW